MLGWNCLRRTEDELPMVTLILFGVLIAVVLTIIVSIHQGRDRYTKMSEAEFEADAKRSSTLGAALLTTHQILTPHHRVEHLQKEDKHLEEDSSESGEQPVPGPVPRSSD